MRTDVKCICVGQYGPNPECGCCSGTGCCNGRCRPRDIMIVTGQCEQGKHLWKSAGGRSCPHGDSEGFGFCVHANENRSQTVYRCQTCGDYDYGDRGGPGHAECVHHCGAPA